MVEIDKIDQRMIANNLEPFEPTHPGEIIRDEIEFRKITQKSLAAKMGVNYTIVNDVINGKRSVNIKFAILCEAALGIPANMLINMQRDYDIYTAKHDKSFMALLEKVKNIAAVL